MKKGNIFDHVKSLDELKPYICPKAVSTRDWENVCLECKGKCDAGKRAIQILDEAAKPDIQKKAGGPGIVTAKMLAGRDAWNDLQHERVIALIRKVFSKAANDDRNPCEVLAEIEGIDATLARKRIDYWIKKYPDLDKELNMKVIMDRYVKRRKRRTNVLSEETSDEVSIGDILKAADEGRLKTDSVEETENGVEVRAHHTILKEAINGVKKQLLAECDSANIEDGGDNPNEICEEPNTSDSEIKRKLLEQFAEDCNAGAVHLPCWGVPKTQHDNVNRPGHYTFGAIEVIDYIRDKMTPEMFQGFCMGNVLKYVSRHKHKNGVEDLKKANVYLGWLIESEEGAE